MPDREIGFRGQPLLDRIESLIDFLIGQGAIERTEFQRKCDALLLFVKAFSLINIKLLEQFNMKFVDNHFFGNLQQCTAKSCRRNLPVSDNRKIALGSRIWTESTEGRHFFLRKTLGRKCKNPGNYRSVY